MTRERDREELTLIDFWGRVPISFRFSLSTAEEALIGPDLGKLAHTISRVRKERGISPSPLSLMIEICQ
jgi:hypothetical protein